VEELSKEIDEMKKEIQMVAEKIGMYYCVSKTIHGFGS